MTDIAIWENEKKVLTMAKEFIERGALIARYDAEHVGPPGRARELMVTAPAADVIEVRHERWEKHGSKWQCTGCKVLKITVQGIVKGDGAGGVSAAQSGVDFALPATLYTVTLTAAGWNNKSQTVSVAGVTANNVVLVQAQADSSQAYRVAKVMADATQVAGQLTFSCTTTPTVDLTVMIIVLG